MILVLSALGLAGYVLRLLYYTLFLPRARMAAHLVALQSQLSLCLHDVESRKAPKPRPDCAFRALWVLLSKACSQWKSWMMTFKPATVIGWHKRLFKLYWRRKSRPGRPPVPPEVQALIRKMATENPAWRSGHIRDELVRLGYPAYDIKTIKKYIPNKLRESDPDRRARWLTFIRNHLSESWAIDFFTVPTWNFRFLYVFVVLEHGRRIVRHFNITANPTMLWVIQQLREATPWGEKPRFLFRDNDDIFDFGVLGFLEANDIEEVRTAYRSPWQNPYVERFIGTVRRELLDHVVVLGERHLGRLLREFVDDYYHPERPHQGVGLDGDAPIHRPVANATEGNSRIISKPILGGLHHRYRRVAA